MHCYKSCWLLSVSESHVAPDPTLVITQVATEAVLSGVEQIQAALESLGMLDEGEDEEDLDIELDYCEI